MYGAEIADRNRWKAACGGWSAWCGWCGWLSGFTTTGDLAEVVLDLV
jgi:hypothetical protein